MSPIILLAYICIIFSSIMLLSSSSWIIMWISLEVNMMSFIPLIYLYNNSVSFESMMKYFLIQVLGSMTFIIPFLICFNSNNYSNNLLMTMILTLSMLLKLAASPFHQWFSSLVEGMTWKTLTILMTWQKINPFIIIFMLNFNYIMIISSILSVFISPLNTLNQTKLKKILALSSISHIGWMISIIFLKSLWVVYIILYSILVMTITISFSWFFINNLYHLYNKQLSYLTLLNFLSLSGLPPFLGFLPKWLSLNYIMINLPILSFPLIFSSLLNIFIYMQILYKFSLLSINKLLKKKLMSMKINLINSISLLILIPIFILIF